MYPEKSCDIAKWVWLFISFFLSFFFFTSHFKLVLIVAACSRLTPQIHPYPASSSTPESMLLTEGLRLSQPHLPRAPWLLGAIHPVIQQTCLGCCTCSDTALKSLFLPKSWHFASQTLSQPHAEPRLLIYSLGLCSASLLPHGLVPPRIPSSLQKGVCVCVCVCVCVSVCVCMCACSHPVPSLPGLPPPILDHLQTVPLDSLMPAFSLFIMG